MDKKTIFSSISIGILSTVIYAIVNNDERKLEDRKEELCILSVVIMISAFIVLLCFTGTSSTTSLVKNMNGGGVSHNTLPPF